MGYSHASTCCCPQCCPPPPEPPAPLIEVELPHVSELYAALAAKDAEIAKLREEHTTAYMVGVEAGKDALRAELEEARKVIEGYRDALHDRKGRPLKCTIWRDGGSVYETDLGESARAFLARKETP